MNGIIHFSNIFPAFFLFLLFKNKNFSEYQIKQFEKIFISLLLIQIIFTFTWKIGINPFPNSFSDFGNIIDYGFGTMGNHLNEADFLACGILYFVPYLFLKNKNFIKTLIFVILLIIFFAETQAMHTIPPLLIGLTIQVILFSYHLHFKKKIKLVLTTLLITTTIIVGINKQQQASQEASFFKKTNYASMLSTAYLNYNQRLETSMKLLNYYIVIKYMVSSPIYRIVFGYGPGNFCSSTGLRKRTELSQKILLLDNVTGSESILDNPVTGFLSIFSEFGLLGLIVIYSFFLKILVFAYKKYRKRFYLAQVKMDSIRIIGIVLYFLPISFIRDFYGDYNFMLAACLLGFLVNRLTVESLLPTLSYRMKKIKNNYKEIEFKEEVLIHGI